MRKPVSDLRTSIVPLEVTKVTNLTGLREQAAQKWGIQRIQPFFPPIEELFKVESLRSPYYFGIKPTKPIQTIVGDTVYIGGVEQPIHRKTTMILPSYRVMRGDFGTSGLPCNKENAAEEHHRLHSPYTAAYVGALANVLLSESGCMHFPEVYGTFTGIADRHTIDISDDYEDICERPWFIQNLGHFFELKLRGSVGGQSPLCMGDAIELDAEELEPILCAEPPVLHGSISDESGTTESEESDDSESVSTKYIFDIRTASSDSLDHEDGEGFDDDDCLPFAEAVFKDVSVQTTVMQKCTDTFYNLLKADTDSTRRTAWIFQVMFALTFAQRTYSFVHNDLHVNNVMYVDTPLEYLYYNVGGKQYRIPTYGKLLKIIDFDRASFSVRLPGMREPRFFLSNQFDTTEEAGGQYNVKPFFTSSFVEIKPNASFDLVRLATSMFWDCFPDGPLHEEYKADPLFTMLMNWMTLPDGSSILFRNLSKNDVHDRYRGFHLYKAIARYCKGTAVPRQQVDKLAGEYVWAGKIPSGESCLCVE
jgi:hypothetical protein